MTFFLSKFLLFLIRPVVWILVLTVYAIFSKHRHLKRKALIAAVILLVFFTNKFILGTVARIYEPKVPTLSHYDVGLLLGGFSSYSKETKALKAEYAGDRMVQALKLYHNGTIDKILMSGGSGSLLNDDPPEALYTLDYFHNIKIPDSAIIIEKQSRNTKENFQYTIQLLKKMNYPNARILVITSAWHIPRTKLLAEQQGLHNLTFYPTNSIADNFTIEDYIVPQAGAMYALELLIKEWVGYVVAKLGIT